VTGSFASYRFLGHHLSNAGRAFREEITAQEFHFGDYTLDQSRYRLQRGADFLRLEKLPMELLILLVDRRGELVSREEIAQRLWSHDVFLDVDHSINTAIRKIRVALRDDPEKPRFVETVVGKGYRFAAPVTCTNGDSKPQVQPLSPVIQVSSQPALASSEASARKKAVSVRLKALLGGVAGLALFGVALLLNRARDDKSKGPPPIRSLAVLPLKNLSGDATQDYLADGMTEAIIGRLAGIHDLRVISRTSAMQFKDSHLSIPEIARTLDVDAIVEGSVIREDSRIRVTAQLIRGATDDHFWSETYDRNLRDVLAIESDVAQSIADKVEVTITGKERERLTHVSAINPEVYDNYFRGQYLLGNPISKPQIEKSIAYFESAAKQDPTFGPAYLGLGNAYFQLSTVFIGDHPQETRRLALSEAQRAVELDPGSAEAHVLLGNTLREQWQWANAENEYRQALALSPNDAAAYVGLGGWLVIQGRKQEGINWAERGRALEPLAVPGSEIAWMLFLSRRYDEAERELRSVLDVQPRDAWSLFYLGFVLTAKNQPAEAIPVLENALAVSDRSPGVIGILIRAYAHAGRRADALKLLAELKRRERSGYVPAGAFVNAYLGLGENDQAFAWLEQAYKEQSNILQFVKVHPFFDPLRKDPRFADLVRRVGLGSPQS
jgi:TolB-like protein/DNA-binding winged helix-turn-helix (wHTH) protein